MGEKGPVTDMGRHGDRPLRGALIGFGNAAARAHLPAWEGNDDFRIVAVAEPDPERARLAAQLLPHAGRCAPAAALPKPMRGAPAKGPVTMLTPCPSPVLFLPCLILL